MYFFLALLRFEELKERVKQQYYSDRLMKNLSPSVWASHQRDPGLGPIYA